MTDMLVKLYELPDITSELAGLESRGIRIIQPMPIDRRHVLKFVDEQFRATSEGWLDECDAALLRHPITCFIAVHNVQGAAEPTERVVGFACYDGSAKGFFGPFGVDPAFRQQGIGRALLIRTLEAMLHAGYGYAIIGWAASTAYYEKAVGAMPIEGSKPGLYHRVLKAPS